MRPQDINTYDAGIIATDPITSALKEEFPIQEGTISMVKLLDFGYLYFVPHMNFPILFSILSCPHMNFISPYDRVPIFPHMFPY